MTEQEAGSMLVCISLIAFLLGFALGCFLIRNKKEIIRQQSKRIYELKVEIKCLHEIIKKKHGT